LFFSSAPGRKSIVYAASIVIGSSVRGLTPCRALRFFLVKVPKPGKVNRGHCERVTFARTK
jgi:hypothetical protein